MKTSLDCLPCFVRQALEAARFMSDDPSLHEQILRQVMRSLADIDFSQAPPVMAQVFYRRLGEIARVDDLYRPAKERFNRLAMDLLPELRTRVRESADPLAAAVRLAIAGNVIDFGINGGIAEQEVYEAVKRAFSEPLAGEIEEFREAIGRAEKILYLTDNAGEIVFDRLLIEQLPVERVVVGVRGRPVINDATIADARAVGLDEIVSVIDNGADVPGTALAVCSAEFLEVFSRSDLVIAKGQGNFETLNDNPGPVFFLFKVKCPVVASHVGLPLGSHVLTRSRRLAQKEQYGATAGGGPEETHVAVRKEAFQESQKAP
jgi:damage-control phosphatase, subfamily I